MIVLATVRPNNSTGSFRPRSFSVPTGADTIEIIHSIQGQGYEIDGIIENPTKERLAKSNFPTITINGIYRNHGH